MRRHTGYALLLVAAGCARAHPVAAPDGRGTDFDRLEDEILHDLAAIDARFARRARLTPTEEDRQRVTMAAVLHEDATIAIVAGAIDPFSFDARGRGLAAVRAKTTALPHDAMHARERELLVRAVDGEVARLEEERDLPRSASALVRAIVEGWSAPADPREAAETDRWLARRLGLVRESMTKAPLDVVRARELDDALDALERVARGLTVTMQELVRLREVLEQAASVPAAKAEATWDILAPRMRAQLGVAATADVLARELAEAEVTLRPDGTDAKSDVVFVTGPCIDEVPGSRVRSMAAPPEREAACQLRHLVALAEDDAAKRDARAVLHDHVVVAQWALDVARGVSTIATAEGVHHLAIAVLPETRARYERIAIARPVAALAAGLTARVLVTGDPVIRAKAWAALGDTPLDLAGATSPGKAL